jgi:hypothetical protein
MCLQGLFIQLLLFLLVILINFIILNRIRFCDTRKEIDQDR